MKRNNQYKKKDFNKKDILLISLLSIAIIAVIVWGFSISNSSSQNKNNKRLQNNNLNSEHGELGDYEHGLNYYIEQSNALLDEGRLKEALDVLYQCKEKFAQSEVESIIEDYFNRVTYTISASPEKCDDEHSFVDRTVYDEFWETSPRVDYGVQLHDTQTDTKETLITIKMPFEFDAPADNDGTVLCTQNDTAVFNIWFGVGAASTFMYNIESNALTTLDFCSYVADYSDDYILLKDYHYTIDDDSGFYLHDWTGKLIVQGETLTHVSLDGEWIYYLNYEKYLNSDTISGSNSCKCFAVERMDINGKTEEVCTLLAAETYAVELEDHYLIISKISDDETHSIDLNEPYDAIINSTGFHKVVTEEELNNTLVGVSGKYVIEFNYADYDLDGQYEAFALVSDSEKISDTGSFAGEFWFVNQYGANCLNDTINCSEYSENFKCTNLMDYGNAKVVTLNYGIMANIYSSIWTVEDSNPKKCEISDYIAYKNLLIYDDRIEVEDSTYDASYEGTPDNAGFMIHTWKSYYLYWDEEAKDIREYGGVEISQEQFMRINGGKEILNRIKESGAEITEIYYRANGNININYIFDNSSDDYIQITYHFNSFMYDEKAGTLTDITNTFVNQSAGFYKKALIEEMATYPDTLPEVFN